VRYLKFPVSLPIIFTSLKGSAMAAVNGAIVGELFGAFQGLGFMILDSRYVGNTARVFLAAVCCTIVGWLLLGILNALERRFVGWHLEMTQQR
jgi:NitT/TauT family transport system permease protein